ncbi:MAG: DUF3472 domain-containing protein [Flavobacteriales bacterium]|nr:DUF3472 domain-containing protein [Flavobacteriales bacterium]MCB9447350.1 DUF3472 domain-containing protein [Flavobacteriales bacterium]
MKQNGSFKWLLVSASFLSGITTASAQHLWYPDRKNGDIIMNEVMVTNTTGCSYWETMGWNVGSQGGAYCGIQQKSQGTNFIFSIWDPIGTSTPITAPYKLPNSIVTKFGGEGTGLHYDDNFQVGWKMNTWVRTVSRRWDYKGHSFFGFWSYDHGTGKWTHHVTMDFPVANVRFNSGGTNSFLEDWCSSSQNYRKGLYKNGYKRTYDTKTWIPWNTASYSGNGSSSTDNKANAGVENGAYFMEFGGSTVKSISEGQSFNITLPALPVLTVGQLTSITVTDDPDSVHVAWVTDQTKSPQFSFTIQVVNSSNVVVVTITDTVPHLRSRSVSIKNLPDGDYTVHVYMTDIFDQQSNEMTKTITIGTTTGISDHGLEQTKAFSLFPNPCNKSANIVWNADVVREGHLSVHDLAGRVIMEAMPVSGNTSSLDVSALPDGVYIVQLTDMNGHARQQLKLIKAGL